MKLVLKRPDPDQIENLAPYLSYRAFSLNAVAAQLQPEHKERAAKKRRVAVSEYEKKWECNVAAIAAQLNKHEFLTGEERGVMNIFTGVHRGARARPLLGAHAPLPLPLPRSQRPAAHRGCGARAAAAAALIATGGRRRLVANCGGA